MFAHRKQKNKKNFKHQSKYTYVTDIFGAIYIDRVVNEGNSQLHPSDWKRYRDDGWDIEENCVMKIKFENLQSILMELY